jgi:hypothetical protein
VPSSLQPASNAPLDSVGEIAAGDSPGIGVLRGRPIRHIRVIDQFRSIGRRSNDQYVS